MTTSADLLDAVYIVLLGLGAGNNPPVYATSAGARVYKPGDWPAWDQQYPVLKLRLLNEVKTALSVSGPAQFRTIATVRVIGEVNGIASPDDGGATIVEDALWALQREVEVAVIGSEPLSRIIEQWPSITSTMAFSAEGEKHLAGMNIDIQMAFYQGPEDFAPVEAEPLEEVHAEVTNHPPVGFTTDLPQ